MFKSILLLSMVIVIRAQIPGLGPCPSVNLLKTIDTKKMSGKWYASERYGTYFDSGKCVVHNLFDLGFGHFVTTTTTDPANNIESSYIGIMASLGTALPGQIIIVYPTIQLPAPFPFNIVNTDYTSYAIVYSCVDLGFAHIKFGWILTRDKIATSSTSNTAYGVMDSAKMDRTILQKIDHATCSANH